MDRDPAVAVLDIGKSNAKLALVDLASRALIAIRTTTNPVQRTDPYPHYDVDRLWQWILEGLMVLSSRARITTISIATHGACFVLTGKDGPVLPVLDYEHPGPEEVSAEYDAIRGDFTEILSPRLPDGLNAGRQLFWLSRRFPEDFARTEAILPYPQYWAWRLSGARTAEATSLGCHTDLWAPRVGTFSRLVSEQGWVRLFPPLVQPWDTVGTITEEVAGATGITRDCRVLAGIHDSNASLLPHILRRQPPFAVLSTGTWLIALAPGGAMERLDPARDCLANVDAFGRAVPSARFMGGREFAILSGEGATPGQADIVRVIEEEVMALPTFAPGTGPFGARQGNWTHDPATLGAEALTVVASLYCALMADSCLTLAGAAGPIVVEGPFARNTCFLSALASLTRRPVVPRSDGTGTTDGAALLAFGPDAVPDGAPDPAPAEPLAVSFDAYAAKWREAAAS